MIHKDYVFYICSKLLNQYKFIKTIKKVDKYLRLTKFSPIYFRNHVKKPNLYDEI